MMMAKQNAAPKIPLFANQFIDWPVLNNYKSGHKRAQMAQLGMPQWQMEGPNNMIDATRK